MQQITKQVNRHMVLHDPVMVVATLEQDEQVAAAPELHHFISSTRRSSVNIFEFVKQRQSDPATKGFISKLQDHLLGRLLSHQFDGDGYGNFTDDD
ncbi:hypothetical protein H0H92_001115 [Tricholoma furcatifolium]|nr:hypothetical protein H0H92_001115 [Tricholoma furcatifolium]